MLFLNQLKSSVFISKEDITEKLARFARSHSYYKPLATLAEGKM